uniref:Uncharacterized protein n=1 Tax=Cyanistes caeruleus TaxID=156563 RepID=A0A8C0U874_CYACU
GFYGMETPHFLSLLSHSLCQPQSQHPQENSRSSPRKGQERNKHFLPVVLKGFYLPGKF